MLIQQKNPKPAKKKNSKHLLVQTLVIFASPQTLSGCKIGQEQHPARDRVTLPKTQLGKD